MQCEKCGGDCWNNAKKNAERAAEGKKPMPLWACKDKDGCGWVKWPPKGEKAQGAPRPQPAQKGPQRPLGPLYFDCMKAAKRTLDTMMGEGKYLPADLVAATATVYISARDGAPVFAPKPETDDA